MSRRGRRRNSRRKSSGGSKRGASPLAFQKNGKSNSVSHKDDVVEKGETDSFTKENFTSESGDEDNKCDKLLESDEENNACDKPPRKENKHHHHADSSETPVNPPDLTEPEAKVRTIKITTSVSVEDPRRSSSNGTSQQTDHSSSSPSAVTNIRRIECIGSSVKFEIQETLEVDTSGVKATFALLNRKADGTEPCLQSKCEIECAPNISFERNVISKSQNENTISYTFSFSEERQQHDAQEDGRRVLPSPFGDTSICRKSCCTNDPDFISTLPPLSYIRPQRKRQFLYKSLSCDQFWDIRPLHQITDTNYDPIDYFTQNIASLNIAASLCTGKQEGYFYPTLNIRKKDTCCPNSLDEGQHLDTAPCFDQLSIPDNLEPMLVRHSSSIGSFSFTKDFVNNHETKAWMRSNSIATVERRMCSVPLKRRQTFPGLSECPNSTTEGRPYRISFSVCSLSSLIMRSPLLGRMHQRDDMFSLFGTGCHRSCPGGSRRPSSEIQNDHNEIQRHTSPFNDAHFEPKAEDVPTVYAQEKRYHPARYSLRTENIGDIADRGDHGGSEQQVLESGIDKDIGEVGDLNPASKADKLSKGNLLIQVIPPSRRGSEERMLEEGSGSAVAASNQSSLGAQVAVELSADGSLERRRQLDRHLSLGSGEPIVLWDNMAEEDSLSTNDITEDDDHMRKPLAVRESISSPAIPQVTEEIKDQRLVTGRRKASEGTNASSVAAVLHLASRPGQQETQSHREVQLCIAEETDKHDASKSASFWVNECLRSSSHKEKDSGSTDQWAKRRKFFKESSRQWSSAGAASISDIVTEDSVSEETPPGPVDLTVQHLEDRGFYTETFHSAAWLFRGDEAVSDTSPSSSLAATRPPQVSIRERTIRINKGTGDYPWGFRIQFSKPIVVTEVDTNGAAEESGLAVGDYVMAVNGTDVTSMPHSEAAELARTGPDVLTLTIGSDIASSPNTPRPTCRGYLYKRTHCGLIKGWRKRWFVLSTDGCLYYYTHKRDEGRRDALSVVKMEGADVRPDATLGKPFVFKCCPLSATRAYYFCTTCKMDMKRWLDAMQKAVLPIIQNHVWVDVTRHNSSLPPLAVKHPDCLGLLHQLDKTKDVWVQRYCILKDGCLYFYSGIRSTCAIGGIYLHGYSVKEQPLGFRKSTIELKPPSDEFKTFHLSAENPTENKRWIMAIRASISKWTPFHQIIQDYMKQTQEETRM